MGKVGAKRLRKVLRDNNQGITKPAIRCFAQRGGVKHISGLIYQETRDVLRVFFKNVIRNEVTAMVVICAFCCLNGHPRIFQLPFQVKKIPNNE